MQDTGLCTQIGLHDTAEYLFLQDIEEEPSPENRDYFDTVRGWYPEWHFVGIDFSPASIITLAERYPQNDMTNWVLANVFNSNHETVWRPLSQNAPLFFQIPTIELAVLLKDIMEGKGAEKIDILALDIEGDEQIILRDFNFDEIRPTHLNVELHPSTGLEMSKDDFVAMILEKDYQLIYENETNTDQVNSTYELQFIDVRQEEEVTAEE